MMQALSAIAAGIGTVALVASVAGLWVGTVLLALGMSLLYPGLFTLAVNETWNRTNATELAHAFGEALGE
mgnify:CR=1 FL=1